VSSAIKVLSGNICVTSVESSGGSEVVQHVDNGPPVGSSAEGTADQCKTWVVDDVAMGCPADGSAEGCITGCSTILLTGIGIGMNTIASGLKSDSKEPSPSSRKAGLSLSMLTLCWPFTTEMVKYFLALWTTRSRPSYGGCKFFFMVSTRMKT